MEAPLRQIVANAGDEPSVIINKVKEGTGAFGYNAANGVYGDMIEMGILDPAKVTRSALQAAASIAGLMITTEAMVSEAAEEGRAGDAGRRHGRHGRDGFLIRPDRSTQHRNTKPPREIAGFCLLVLSIQPTAMRAM